MNNALDKEDLWFQEWFKVFSQCMGLGEKKGENQGDSSAFEEEMPIKNSENAPSSEPALLCVTSLYQQECFPYLYIQKNAGVLRNQRMLLTLTMILRTHYEGAEKESLCLKKIRSAMVKPFSGVKTNTKGYFQEKTMTPKITDKKMREVALVYDARILWHGNNANEDQLL